MRGRGEQLGRGPVAARLRGEPLVELDGPHLLEEVDHRVAVAAQGERDAGVGSARRRTDAVAEVALGGRAHAHVRRGLAPAARCRRRSGGWRARRWCASPSTPWSASSWVGVTPYAARHASFSAGCSDRWTCSGRGTPSSPTAASTTRSSSVRRHRPHRVHRRCHPEAVIVAEHADPIGPGLGVAVVEPPLHALQRDADPAGAGSRCRAGSAGSRPPRGRRAAPRPSRSGRRSGVPPGRGAGSGTPRPTVTPASAISPYTARASSR